MRESVSDEFSSASERLAAPGDGKLIVGRSSLFRSSSLIVPSRLVNAVNHLLRSKGRIDWAWISQEELDSPYAELRPHTVRYPSGEWGLWCSKCENWFVCHWRGPDDA